MKQGLTVVAVGLILAAFGVGAVWQGYDIVQLERGWTQVIAGTTAFVGGLVLAALGLLIGAIEALRRQVEAGQTFGLPAGGPLPLPADVSPDGTTATPLRDWAAARDPHDAPNPTSGAAPPMRRATILDRLRVAQGSDAGAARTEPKPPL